MIFFVPSLLAIYAIARFVPPLPIPVFAKWIIAAILLIIANHYLINHFLPGGLGSPEVPYAYIVIMGTLFGAFILLVCFMGLRDIAMLGFWIARKCHLTTQAFPFAGKTNIVLSVVALLLAMIGCWQAVKVPDVKRVDITLAKLPPQLEGFKIVQLTDVHACRLFPEAWIRAVVDKANAQNPDLMVVTGDILDGTVEKRADDVAPLANMRARLGVYVVTGNHEYYSNYAQWMRKFKALGLQVLSNEHVTLTDNGAHLILAGTTDRVSERFDLPQPNIEKTLAGADTTLPIILLAHQPKGADKNAAAGVDLQLSGHTHGGQILGIHWLNKIMNEGFVSGIYDVQNMKLYVSNGTGLWNGFPIRLGKPSEITEIVLHHAQN